MQRENVFFLPNSILHLGNFIWVFLFFKFFIIFLNYDSKNEKFEIFKTAPTVRNVDKICMYVKLESILTNYEFFRFKFSRFSSIWKLSSLRIGFWMQRFIISFKLCIIPLHLSLNHPKQSDSLKAVIYFSSRLVMLFILFFFIVYS